MKANDRFKKLVEKASDITSTNFEIDLNAVSIDNFSDLLEEIIDTFEYKIHQEEQDEPDEPDYYEEYRLRERGLL